MSDLTRCDEEGVPCMIQVLDYYPAQNLFALTLCTGEQRTFPRDKVLPSVIPAIGEPSDKEFQRAHDILTRYFEERFSKPRAYGDVMERELENCR